uniref:Uncharacterized protein n=1 Tax=Methylophaga nitratireducenticrescens TaxID=754476 RepID=I1XHT3_METNJ
MRASGENKALIVERIIAIRYLVNVIQTVIGKGAGDRVRKDN